MLEKIKKHSVKIFVFTINILLAAIAVLIIREKDQARLLENSQKENPANENAAGNSLPSFENSVSVEDSEKASSAEINSGQTDAALQPSSVDSGAVAPITPGSAVSAPATSAPAPAITMPSNAKTKTS